MSAGESLVLVPLNGSTCDERAIEIAILLTKRNQAPISIIHVVEVPQELPLEAEMDVEVSHGDEVLQAAQQVALQYGREVEIELLQARSAGAAIVDEAIQRGATLIVMATSIHRRAGEATVGRTTVPYVMKNAPCEVVVCRRPLGMG